MRVLVLGWVQMASSAMEHVWVREGEVGGVHAEEDRVGGVHVEEVQVETSVRRQEHEAASSASSGAEDFGVPHQPRPGSPCLPLPLLGPLGDHAASEALALHSVPQCYHLPIHSS